MMIAHVAWMLQAGWRGGERGGEGEARTRTREHAALARVTRTACVRARAAPPTH
jgi:hypothetical protein